MDVRPLQNRLEVTPEIEASTDRVLEACDQIESVGHIYRCSNESCVLCEKPRVLAMSPSESRRLSGFTPRCPRCCLALRYEGPQ